MIGNQLKILRKEFGLSQTEFGKKIGKTLRAVQNWESGERKIDDSMVQLIALVFGTNEQWLRTGQGIMFKSDDRQHYELGDFGNINIAGKVNLTYHTQPVSPVADLMQDDIIKLNELILEVGTPRLLKKWIKQLEDIKKIQDEG